MEAKRGQGGRDRYEVRARQIRGGGEAEAEARQRSGEAEVRRGRGQARQGGGDESFVGKEEEVGQGGGQSLRRLFKQEDAIQAGGGETRIR